VTRVHLQRAVDGELRRAAQVGAEGRLGDMSLGDGGQSREQLGSSEHHDGEGYGGRLSGCEGNEEEEQEQQEEVEAKVEAMQCSGPLDRAILAQLRLAKGR